MSSSAIDKPARYSYHRQLRSRVSTNSLKTNTRLGIRRRIATSLDGTNISGAIPYSTIMVIGAWRKATTHGVLATKSVVGTVPSRREAETGGIVVAVCEAAAGLPLAFSTGADTVLADAG